MIETAKRMGLETIVASIPGNYPGFALADKVVYENTVDKDAMLALAKEEQVAGVCVCGTDVCVPAQGYVCDQLGLKGPSEVAAERAQDKALMQAAFEKGGVRTARFIHVDIDNANPVDICEEIGYPVIFKSVDSSGSRGITRVNGPEDIAYAYEQVKENTHADHYLIEEFLIGDEFGAQAFVLDGEVQFFLPHGDYVFQGDNGVPIGHFAPYDMGADIVADAEEQLRRAVKSLEVDNCAINADFILCKGKTYVLEIGARAGATCLVEMTSLYYGFDYYEKIIQCNLGEKPDFTPQAAPQPNAEMLFQAPVTGKITEIDLSGVTPDERIIRETVGKPVVFSHGPDEIISESAHQSRQGQGGAGSESPGADEDRLRHPLLSGTVRGHRHHAGGLHLRGGPVQVPGADQGGAAGLVQSGAG